MHSRLYVRDTALRLRQQGMELSRASLSAISNLNNRQGGAYKNVGYMQNNPYTIDTPHGTEDISWLL